MPLCWVGVQRSSWGHGPSVGLPPYAALGISDDVRVVSQRSNTLDPLLTAPQIRHVTRREREKVNTEFEIICFFTKTQ